MNKRLTLFVVSAAILFDAFDLSITQVALPSIQADLDVSTATLQWVPNAYVLTYGGLLLLGGRAADLLGRRRIFVSGLVLFAAMSLACGLAPSTGVLVVSRGLQGIGAAMTVPAAVSIIAAMFAEGPERNRALGVFGAWASAGFSVGLVAGGVLTDVLSWRWIFLAKVPFVLAVAALAWRVVPDPGEGRQARTRGFDGRGAVLAAAGLLLVVFVITQLADPGLSAGALAGIALVAVLCLIAFAVNERRTADPLLPLEIFRRRSLRYADVASLTVLAAPFGVSYIVTLYLQRVESASPLTTGLQLLPGAILTTIVSRNVAPRLIDRFGLRSACTGGLVVVALGVAVLLRLDVGSHYAAVVLPSTLIAFGLGMGVAYAAFTVAAVAGVPEDQQGVAAGIQNTALQVGGGLGLALVGAVIAARLPIDASPEDYVRALRGGVVVTAALPLLGAAVTFFGLAAQT
jgi:EmrB/QacA subfamily drug resistance transporter